MPKKITEEQRKRLKENLPTIRKIIGFSADELGKLIGLTRQSVTNLETGNTKLTTLHFRAITQVIDEIYTEKICSGDNPIIFIVMTVFIKAEELEEDEYIKWKRVFTQLSALMREGVVDDPVATLKGLVFGAYELSAGDTVPANKMLDAISEAMSEVMSEMVRKVEGAIDAFPES